MACRVLCSGDIHIGRRATKVRGSFRTADAWAQIVDAAIAEQVHLVALSGDLLDRDNSAYEAIGPFQEGLRRLGEAGIQTVAVTGNHDFDVLPRIARIASIEGFHLLGAGGTWEQRLIELNGTPVLEVIGWSFPSEHVSFNPIGILQRRSTGGLPTLGLLHTDVGAARSNFAPVRLADLWDKGVDFWLLGHIHVPGIHRSPGKALAVYPGSPFAMDPGEPGVHGVWIIDFKPGESLEPRPLQLSPVRYISARCDLTGVENEEGFLTAITTKLSEIGQRATQHNNKRALREVSCRIHLHGACSAHQLVASWADRARSDIGTYAVESVELLIDEITSDVHPPVDLLQLSTGNDPVAETAKLLLALETEPPVGQYAELVERTHRSLGQIYGNPGYNALLTENDEVVSVEPSEHDARTLLSEQGWRLLSALLSQKAMA